MSVNPPVMTVALGSVGVPQADIIEAMVHLGATKEVSSWELLCRTGMENTAQRHLPAKCWPRRLHRIGRGANIPQLITTRTESIKFESTPTEHYVKVAGRCWGEKLFRQT